MAQFCQPCSKGKLVPIEMDEVGSGVRCTIYRCPMCSQQREVTGQWGGGEVVQSVTTEQANRQIRKGRVLTSALTIGITALGEYCKAKNKEKNKP